MPSIRLLARRTIARLAQNRCADDGGFTVIEALVSFVLLAVVGAASTTAVVSGNSASKVSSDRSTAANLAQQDLQAARSLDYPNYPAAAQRTSTVGKTTYTIKRAVASTCPAVPDPDNHTWMQVTTTVSWLPTRAQNTVVMATEIAC